MEAQDYIISVVPRSSRDEVVTETCSYLKVKLTATPVKGEANKALIKFLAKKFDVPQSHIDIMKGLTAKEKLVRIYLPKSKK